MILRLASCLSIYPGSKGLYNVIRTPFQPADAHLSLQSRDQNSNHGIRTNLQQFLHPPNTQALRNPTGSFLHLLRDNFSITTWLLFGTLLQGLACLLLPYPNIALIAPVTLFLLFKLIYITLIALALIPDPLAKNVIPGRSVPIFPNPKTGQQDTPSGQSVTAILLATRANSSLGIFSPGFKEVGDYFASFIREMNTDPTRYGYLGSNTLLSANGDQATGAESMGLVYFENEQKLHEFAHGPSHTAAVEWYMRNGGRDFAHTGLMHEAFAAPRNGWEGIYLNFKPTGTENSFIF